jgi:hypothetical protein
VTFLVETDALTLAAQPNRSATDLPEALVAQWLARIRPFEFEARHSPRSKDVVADALSRSPATGEGFAATANEEDLDEWLTAQVSMIRACPISIDNGMGEEWLSQSEGTHPVRVCVQIKESERSLH